jgi:hypothetical protein
MTHLSPTRHPPVTHLSLNHHPGFPAVDQLGEECDGMTLESKNLEDLYIEINLFS